MSSSNRKQTKITKKRQKLINSVNYELSKILSECIKEEANLEILKILYPAWHLVHANTKCTEIDIKAWLEINCKKHYHHIGTGCLFEDKAEAAKFIIVWT
jgi:hypothetical protein